jgi:hypothetical protein
MPVDNRTQPACFSSHSVAATGWSGKEIAPQLVVVADQLLELGDGVAEPAL